MADRTYSGLLLNERAYTATRVILAVIAWLLVWAGLATGTGQLYGPLMLIGTFVATSTTIGVVLASRFGHVAFETILVWAAPVDLVAVGVLIAALHGYGDPILAVVLAFVVFYGHLLERRPALLAAVAATLVYLGSHAWVYQLAEWHETLFLGMKGLAVLYVGVLSSVMSERHREREYEVGEAVLERGLMAEELQRRVDELHAILDVNEMVHSSFDLDRVGADIVETLCRTIGIAGATVLVMDKRKNETLLSASSGLTRKPDDLPDRFAVAIETDGQLELAGQHLVCRSIQDHKSMIVLFCTDPSSMERLGQREMQVLKAVSTGLVVAVENSRLYRLTHRLSVTDDLTGLYNYRYLQQRLDEELERSRRYEKTFSLLMLDIDGFKRFNDTQGHLAGDRALADLGGVIRSAVREVDVVTRYGGEEFSVILPETDESGALIVAEKIREAVAAHAFLDIDGESLLRLTVSIGLATYPVHATDKESLLRHADDAVYQAKADGKDRVRVAQVHEGGNGEDADAAETGGIE